jgi:hypothetical protein
MKWQSTCLPPLVSYSMEKYFLNNHFQLETVETVTFVLTENDGKLGSRISRVCVYSLGYLISRLSSVWCIKRLEYLESRVSRV